MAHKITFGIGSAHAMVALCLALVPAMAQGQQLQPAPARIGPAAIRADQATYATLQHRIKALNDKAVPVSDYALAKAQCWLDTSFHEYSRNDRGGYPQAALGEATRLVTALENGADPGMETPLVNGAQKLRPDLWAIHDALKQQPGLRCAAQATACAEVELVHAGNEIHDGGWRHANPYIQIAEDLTAQAQTRAQTCAVDEERRDTGPAAAPERLELSADALFAFNRGDVAGLLPRGKAELDQLAARLRGLYSSIERIDLTGHSDRLGSDAGNQRLSEQRAEAVRTYLQQAGVEATMHARGAGEGQPGQATGQCQGERATPALVQCLQPDRRVTVEIVGTRHPARTP